MWKNDKCVNEGIQNIKYKTQNNVKLDIRT